MSNFNPLRWGVLGCGSIANRVSNDVSKLPDHQIRAIASRDSSKAGAFAEKFSVPTQHLGAGAYESLVNDPEVDVIYVTTPHSFHHEHALLALNAGKPVLCEKPFSLHLWETKEMIDKAHEKNLFLMEGMWSILFPVFYKLRELIAQDAIGEIRIVEADFGYQAATYGACRTRGKESTTSPPSGINSFHGL